MPGRNVSVLEHMGTCSSQSVPWGVEFTGCVDVSGLEGNGIFPPRGIHRFILRITLELGVY